MCALKFLEWLRTISVALASVPLVFALLMFVCSKNDRISFDTVMWQKCSTNNNPLRIRMVDDLLFNHPLIGRSKVDVDALLGAPTKDAKLKQYDYVYWLAPTEFLPIDSRWLCIRFANGKVSKAVVLVD